MNSHNNIQRRYERGDRRVAAIGLILIVIGLTAGVYRAIAEYSNPGPFSFDKTGYCDYHNGLYFPSRAVLDGVSPYGEAYVAAYPVDRQVPFFSPAFFMLHVPITIWSLHVSEVLFFILTVLTALGIGFVAADAAGFRNRIDVILVATATLVLSRGGHTTIQDGYFTFELVLATLLAIRWGKNRPWLAAIALLVVSAKPTYVIPLGFLLLARGNFKALVIGAVFSIVGAALPFAWLSYNLGDGDLIAGFSQIVSDIQGTQTKHLSVSSESPINTWTRLDLLAIIAKWIKTDPSQTIHLVSMLAILTVPMPSKLTRLLKKGYELNGKGFFDRRGHHQRKADKTPIHQKIAATVGQMIESGKTVAEVAVQLGVDTTTVNKALSWYCDNNRDAA